MVAGTAGLVSRSPVFGSGDAGLMPERAGGEIGRLIAERDWSRSPLGPPSSWPPELRDSVRLILPAEVQIVMFWGEEYVALYNDA